MKSLNPIQDDSLNWTLDHDAFLKPAIYAVRRAIAEGRDPSGLDLSMAHEHMTHLPERGTYYCPTLSQTASVCTGVQVSAFIIFSGFINEGVAHDVLRYEVAA